MHGHSHRPKIIIEQQPPEVIFQNAPTSVRAPSNWTGCPKQECRGQAAGFPAPAPAAGFPNQQYGTPSYLAGAPAPAMALTAVPVMGYQMQMVPTMGYQYQMMPVPQQTAGFALQGPPPAQPQTAGLAPEIGIGLTQLELLLRSPAAARVEQAVLRKFDPPVVCPDEAIAN